MIFQEVAVLVPREERLDGTGGAVATWVSRVQKRSPGHEIFGLDTGSPDFDSSSTRLASFLHRLIDYKSRFLARVTNKSQEQWQRIFWLRGFAYVLALFPKLKRFPLLYIHNRPRYAVYARRLGYKGRIVLHMHNDPKDYFKGSASEAAKHIDYFVGCSEFIRSRSVSACGIRLEQSSVIYNGVDALHLSEVAPMQADLLFVGRLLEIKGPDLAISAVAELRRRSIPARLRVVGGTESGLRTSDSEFLDHLRGLAAAINQENATEVVSFLGPVPLHEVLELMSQSPLLLFPSRFQEPFGMVLAEGISRGCHPIASNRGGIPEVLEIAGIASVLESLTPESLADAVVDALNTIEDETRINAAQTLTKRLSWTQIGEDYRQTLRSFV